MSDSSEVQEIKDGDRPRLQEENYNQEIDDIVKGFILEKDILKQGHDEELARMKEHFRQERSNLLKQFEKERQDMLRNTNREALPSEPRYTSSSADSALGFSCSHDHSSNDAVFENQWEQLSSTARRVTKGPADMDLSAIREIAEIYLRMQNGHVTSGVRPDLDLEDKFEREREVLEQSFIVEKRELKRKVEEDFNRRLEQERGRYEVIIQEQKSVISDLQWQKRELENRLRHDREKTEIQFEREKNEIEKTRMQEMQDLQRKVEAKYSNELSKQREKYEENINELQADITRLTLQLRELNENLKHEKEIIVTKFEREIKEMEITFAEQRVSIQSNLESEFAMKLENETTLLKSMNNKLKEDLDTLERDKRDIERKLKEERRKLEEQYEDEIVEMGRKYAEDKKAMKLRTEERYHQMLMKERGPWEENIVELQGEIHILRQENTQLEVLLNERTEEMRKQIDFEREEARRKVYSEREDIRARIENEFSQKLILETTSQQEIAKTQEIELSTLHARCLELEGRVNLLTQEKETLLRDREQLENNIRMKEMELNSQQEQFVSQKNANKKNELKEVIRKKDSELSTLTLEKERLEISLSAFKREKIDLEDEIDALKRTQNAAGLSKDKAEKTSRASLDNSELVSLQEAINKNEKEIHDLKREKYDLENKVSSLQRKVEELEDELLSLRKKKLEVEDEISALKRDKTESDDQLAAIRREKIDLEEQVSSLKRKLSESEDEVSAFKRAKIELDHEIAMLKRFKSDIEKQTSVTQHHQHVTRNVRFEESQNSRFNDQTTTSRQSRETDELEAKINRLIKQKQDLESDIRDLKSEKAEIEQDLRSQKKILQETTEKQNDRDEKVKRWDIEKQKHELDYKIASLKEEQRELQHKISHLQRDVSDLEKQVSSFTKEKNNLERAITPLKLEKQTLETKIESLQGEFKRFENKMSDVQVSRDRFREDAKSEEILRLTQQRDELTGELSSLRKQLLQLQSQLSEKSFQISKESLQIEEKEIHEIKRDRMELERIVAALRRKKTELETEITVQRDVRKREETDTTSLKKEKIELDVLLTALHSQKTRLEAEAAVLRNARKSEEEEISSLRKEKNNIEKELYALQSQQWKLEADISVADDSWRKKGSAISGLNTDIVEVEEQLTKLKKQKSDLQHEVSQIQSTKHREEKELISIRQEKGKNYSSLDVGQEQRQLQSLKMEKDKLKNEIVLIQKERLKEENELKFIRNEKREIENTLLSLRKEIDHCDSFATDIPSASTPRLQYSQPDSSSTSKFVTSSGNYGSDRDILTRIDSSLSNESRFTRTILNSSPSPKTSNVKDYNELKYLRDEKTQLQTQICELRAQLSTLQTEVTELENRKSLLVGVRDSHVVFGMDGLNRLQSRSDSEQTFQEDLKEELSKAASEEKRESIIQDYENRIKELKERNLELKRRVGLLEWQVENMKQKLEIQEVSHRREMSALKEKQLMSTVRNESTHNAADSTQLQSFYNRLSRLLEGRQTTTEDIMKEIRKELRNFEQKLAAEDKNLSRRQKRKESPLYNKVDQENVSVKREVTAARDYASQLKKQLETADNQLKTCEKIIHRLYNENSELNKTVSSMDDKLKHAARSQEKLQRKKVLLQRLVDKLSSHLGKDVLQQSYLVLELDKDVVS